MVTRGFVIFLLIINSCTFISAQRLELIFHDPFLSDPLPDNNVSQVAQDTLGRIWIVSENGLFRYNGLDIQAFYHNPADSTTIPSSTIHDLRLGSKGYLWASTDKGLSKYEYGCDCFDPVINSDKAYGLETVDILKTKERADGEVFLAAGSSIYRYQEDTVRLVFTLNNTWINDFAFDSLKGVWIVGSGDTGLVYFDLKTNESKVYKSDPEIPSKLGSNEIRSVSEHHGKLWLATNGDGVHSFDPINETFTRYPYYSDYDKYVIKTYVDRDERLWVIDWTGLKLYDEGGDYFHAYYAYDDNTVKPDITNIFQDRQGNYWTCHMPGGINVRFVSKGFKNLNTSQERRWHLSDNYITAVSADAEGNWWFGNYHNGIDVFRWATERLYLGHQDNDPSSLGGGSILEIFTDSRQQIWVGSYLGGLHRYEPANQSFVTYSFDPEDSLSISGNDVRSIAEDSDGRLWVATHGSGLNLFEPTTERFTRYTKENSGLSNDWLYKVLVDDHQNVWTATAHGVSLLRGGKLPFETYTYSADDTNTITENHVFAILESHDNTIWVGTGKGLCKYNAITNDFSRVDLGDEKRILSIEEDELGFIWCASDKGLIRYAPAQNTYHKFTKDDGLQSGTFNIDASYHDDGEGYLFFAGKDGVNYFKGRDIRFNTSPPKVVFSDFRLFNTSVTPSENGILESHVSVAEQVLLDFDQNVLTIEYFSDNLIRPEKNEFMYKLEGFDKDWIIADSRNTVTYTNLNPGTYSFHVKSSNNDGLWNENPSSLLIIVKPPYWQTWWFRLLIFIGTGGIIYGIYLFRTRDLIKQKKQLKDEVRERTIELAEKNAQLVKSNQAKDTLMSIIGHDLRGPFGRILGFSELLKSQYDNLTEKERKESSYHINSSASTVYNLLDNLLKWIKSQSGIIDCNPIKIDIYGLIEESLDIFLDFFAEKQIKLVFNREQPLIVLADVEMVKTILRNLVSNAIKFTGSGGEISIGVEKYPEHAEVSVTDTGVGMDKEEVSVLFNNGVISKRGTAGEEGHSLGLQICKKFVESNKGTIEVNSKEGVGSTFRFTLPLP